MSVWWFVVSVCCLSVWWFSVCLVFCLCGGLVSVWLFSVCLVVCCLFVVCLFGGLYCLFGGIILFHACLCL